MHQLYIKKSMLDSIETTWMKRIQSKTSHLFSLMPCDTAEDTLLCLNNLAGVLRSVNEIDDAEECYKEIGRNRANGVFNEAEIRPWGRSMLSKGRKGSAGRVCSKIVSSSGLFTISCCFACCTAVKLRPSCNGDLDAGVSWWSELTLVWSWEGGGNLLNFWESKPMTRSHADWYSIPWWRKHIPVTLWQVFLKCVRSHQPTDVPTFICTPSYPNSYELLIPVIPNWDGGVSMILSQWIGGWYQILNQQIPSSQEAATGIVEKLGDKHPTSYLDLLGARCKVGQRESKWAIRQANLGAFSAGEYFLQRGCLYL